MARRRYDLGKRAEGVAATRRRIVDAASAAYRAHGIAATSMQEVARRARVSPATVLHHFPTPDKLVAAVVESLTAELAVPTEELVAGARSVAERLRRLARALAAFYERSEKWYEIHARERDAVPALARGEARFYRDLERLMRAALGPAADDPRALAAVSTMMSPAVFGGLRAHGMTAEDAADLVADVLAPWARHLPRR